MMMTRVGSYHGFSAQLTHCCSQIVVRQPSLAAPIYQVLLPIIMFSNIIIAISFFVRCLSLSLH